MKVLINAKVLKETLATANKVLPRSEGKLPILNHFLLVATDTIQVSSNCLEAWATVQVPSGTVQESGSVCFHRSILQTLKTVADSAQIELTEEVLLVDGLRIPLMTLPVEEFPVQSAPYYATTGFELELPAQEMRELLKKASVCVAKSDESRAVMTGIQFLFEGDKVRLESTDGRRASALEVENWPVDEQEGFILPGALASVAQGILKGSQELAFLRFEEGNAYFLTEGVTIGSRQVYGTFPNFKMIQPKPGAYKYETLVLRKRLIETLKRLLSLPQEKTCPNQIIMEVEQNGNVLTVTAAPPGLPWVSEQLPCNVRMGDYIKIAMNGKYLLEWLLVNDSEEVDFLFQCPDRSLKVDGMIMMPIRIREEATEYAKAA